MWIAAVACLVVAGDATLGAQQRPFAVEEATIESIHAAFRARTLTCAQLVRAYLDRIEAFDDRGPAINAIITVNPQALDTAAAMDREGMTAAHPLHCIPVILKDNYDTFDMPTSGGSVTFAKSIPPDDAFVVKKLRDAGALIIAKANLTELALTGVTVSSLGGQTKNPYDLTRTPGGSSGGTGAAIAANFGVLGTGSDTGQSIRSPSSANSLVGLRPTRGLVSRDGIMPFSATQDEGGPMTRTVEDAARMLDVMAGYDAADPITAFNLGRIPRTYTASLDRNGLKGARIGLLTEMQGRAAIHAEVNAAVDQAVAKMTAMGATVEKVTVPNLDALTRGLSLMNLEFQPTFNKYLASLGPNAPVKTFREFMAKGEVHPSLKNMLEGFLQIENGPNTPEYQQQLQRRTNLRQALMTLMASNKFDAILYPHQRRLVVPIGEDQAERNGVLSNSTGFPALTFPGGFSAPTANAPIGVPIGLEFLGPEWSEPVLIRLAYAFQEGAHVRKPPASTPPVRPMFIGFRARRALIAN